MNTAADPGIKHEITLFGSRSTYWTYHPDRSKTIVVVHGFRGTHRGLLDIAQKLPGYRLIIPDLPGFGRSTPMTEQPHTIEGYAQYIKALITSLHLKNVVVLGHSMGTTVAAELQVQAPTLATHLIMINPIAEHPLRGIGRLKMAPGVFYHWVGGRLLPEQLGRALLSHPWFFYIGSVTMTKTRNRSLRRRIHNNHIRYMGDFTDRRTLLEAYESSMNNTVTTRAPKIAAPTLLIAGKVDAIAPIAGQRKLVKLFKRGKLVELDQVGHIIHYEQPAAAAEAINAFLDPKNSGA